MFQLGNLRRSLDELKLLHRAVSVSSSTVQQSAANFMATPVDEFNPDGSFGRSKAALSSLAASSAVYIASDGAGGSRAVVAKPGMSIGASAPKAPAKIAAPDTKRPEANPTRAAVTRAPPASSPEVSGTSIEDITASATAAVLESMGMGSPRKSPATPAGKPPSGGRVVNDGGFKMDLSFLDIDADALVADAVAQAGRR